MENSPHVVIPATAELVLHAVERQLAARVLRCSKGGYIVIFEGRGMAGKSSWEEVVECIEEVGRGILGAELLPSIPSGVRPDVPKTPDAAIEESYPTRALHLIGAIITTAMIALSVKIT